jgi:hydroxyacylglutathione hydrolase
VEPDNQQIKALIESVSKLREADLPSLPSNLELEKQINPFLRSHIKPHWAHIANKTNTAINDEESAFAAVRKWKDSF